MMRNRFFAFLMLGGILVAAPAGADETPVATPSPEERSLQGFGASAPECLEWSDGCAVCARNDSGVAHCSTPGIACQPSPILCRKEKPK